MGKGIREMAMSPEPEKPSHTKYDPYYSGRYYNPEYYDQRYGGYDGSETKEEPKDLITIKMLIPYKDMGQEFDMDSEFYTYEPDKAEFKAKEIAYDRLTNLIGKGFESKFSMVINATDNYDEFEIEIVLTPIKQ